MGAPRAGRSHARPPRSHHRRARGARPAPHRESRAADGARHPKKSRGLLREAPGVRVAWIAAEKAQYTIAECCRALRVSASGFYAWPQRPESPPAVRDRQRRVLIRASHEGNRRADGSPRELKDLLEPGIPISRKRVVRLMRAEGLEARVRKRFHSTTMSDHDQPIAGHGLDRPVVAERPHQRAVMESWFSTVKREEAERVERDAHAKEPCSMTSRCSITSSAPTLHARSDQPCGVRASRHCCVGGTVGRSASPCMPPIGAL